MQSWKWRTRGAARNATKEEEKAIKHWANQWMITTFIVLAPFISNTS